MYIKHLIKLLATEGSRSIYHTARHQVKASDSNIWYAFKRLKTKGVVNENNELTDLGWRLFKLIEATEQDWVRREECLRRFGSDVLEVGKKLRIIVEKESVILIKEIKDPSPEDFSVAKRESNASQLATRAFTIIKRAALNWPLVADIIQRRRAMFNKRLNFWFLGDIPPPPPPFPPVSPDSAIELMEKNV